MTRQLQRLQTVATELQNAPSSQRALEIAVHHGIAALGAKDGASYVFDSDGHHARVTRWRDSSEHPAQVALQRGSPLAEAFHGGGPILIESADQLAVRYPDSSSFGGGQGGALALLPLVVDGSTLGCISLGFGTTREFLEHERSFLSLLAFHCTQALRRTEVQEQEKRWRQRVKILAEAGDLLAKTLDYEATLRTIVAMTMPALADFCFLDVTGESGTRRICDAYEDPETAELLGRMRWLREQLGRAAGEGQSQDSPAIFQPDLDEALLLGMARGPEELELLRRLKPCSLISVPLLSHGERVGTLTLCHGRSRRRHTAGDLAIAEELALRAAQSVCHARLYLVSQQATQRAEEAARQAEEASRLKDEFLSTVSHELRTPLSAILGWATLLRRERRTTPSALDRGLEVIERNARAQQRIVEEILDASRMACGKFRIRSAPVDLQAIAIEACDSLRYAASARRVELVLSAPDGPYQTRGDADRLRQILWNLLSNAIKFTPAGGTVKLRIARIGEQIAVTVRDTGDGIEPTFLPFVFKYFRQADGTTTRTHGGLGLGLAMVRHLVEMHGGTVTAESEGPGKGATFTVMLPVGADPT